MQEITSLQNQTIKLATSLHLKKYRDESGLFLIEGKKCLMEAMKSGLKLTHIFAKESMESFPEEITYIVDEKILKKISTTDTPPDVIAIAKQFEWDINDLLTEKNPLIIVLENIKDPGNLGTIIRTTKASGASGIILTDNTADIFNPKVVRSTVGNLWKIPIITVTNTNELKNILKSCQIIGTSSHSSSKIYYNVDYKMPTAVVFGSEAEGMTKEMEKQVNFSVQIPVDKEVESLNLSISVGVILYEANRQRSLS